VDCPPFSLRFAFLSSSLSVWMFLGCWVCLFLHFVIMLSVLELRFFFRHMPFFVMSALFFFCWVLFLIDEPLLSLRHSSPPPLFSAFVFFLSARSVFPPCPRYDGTFLSPKPSDRVSSFTLFRFSIRYLVIFL